MLREYLFFSCDALGHLVPLEGSITANQCKVLLTDHLHVVIKHFYPHERGLCQGDPFHAEDLEAH